MRSDERKLKMQSKWEVFDHRKTQLNKNEKLKNKELLDKLD